MRRCRRCEDIFRTKHRRSTICGNCLHHNVHDMQLLGYDLKTGSIYLKNKEEKSPLNDNPYGGVFSKKV